MGNAQSESNMGNNIIFTFVGIAFLHNNGRGEERKKGDAKEKMPLTFHKSFNESIHFNNHRKKIIITNIHSPAEKAVYNSSESESCHCLLYTGLFLPNRLNEFDKFDVNHESVTVMSFEKSSLREAESQFHSQSESADQLEEILSVLDQTSH